MARRAGKYAHITSGLPKMPGVEPERTSIVEMTKTEIMTPLRAEEVPITDNHHKGVEDLLDSGSVTIKHIIDIEKRACADRQHYAAGFAQEFTILRSVHDCVKDWLANIQLIMDAYEELMTAQMEQEGVTSLRMTDGGSVTTYIEPYASVIDKDLFRQWCVAPADRCMTCGSTQEVVHGDESHPFKPGGGMENLLQLWPSTTQAVTKERLLAGEAIPDGVSVFAKTMVRINKAK